MFVDDLRRDLQYAVRMLIKTPVLTGVTLLTLVLGIGANLAIFGIVNAVLLQPLALRQPDRLVRVFDDLPGAGAKDVGMSVPEMADVSARTDVFEQVTGSISLSTALAGGDHVERVELLVTLPNYFDVLGAKPAIGRAYTQAEWTPGFTGTVVISDGLWKRQFGGDPHVIGRRIRVDEDPYTIIGVMPPGFKHPAETVSGDVFRSSCAALEDLSKSGDESDGGPLAPRQFLAVQAPDTACGARFVARQRASTQRGVSPAASIRGVWHLHFTREISCSAFYPRAACSPSSAWLRQKSA